MYLVVFENNKALVIDEFRAGRFDYVELASDVAETKFFQFLFGAGIVDKLAQDFPTPRERELVPRATGEWRIGKEGVPCRKRPIRNVGHS